MKCSFRSREFLIFLHLLLPNLPLCAIDSAVTFAPQGGRLGNSLLAYAHTKWFAYYYDLPMLYPPFPYSEQLMLHNNCRCYTPEMEHAYKRIILERSPFQASSLKKTGILYEIPWFVPFSYEGGWAIAPFQVNWKDATFLELLRNDFSPQDPAVAQAVEIPSDKISVAVHVRKGGGADLPLVSKNDSNLPLISKNGADVFWPQKFPPDSYYIEQIKTISKRFNHQPLYVHIFTDDQNPEQIVQKYRTILNLSNIEFGYRKEGNTHHTNVLEDLFGMAKCDCLIMPASIFSYVASKIGNHRVVIMPAHHRWEHGRLIIDGVTIINAG